MSGTPIAAAPTAEISIRAQTGAEFDHALAQQRVLQAQGTSVQTTQMQVTQTQATAVQQPPFGDVLFAQIDRIERQRAALDRAMRADDPKSHERMIATAFDCAIETACFGRAGSLLSGSVKSLVQAQ